MTCPSQLREFGVELAKRLRSREGLSILPEYMTTWTEGGCAVLAESLRQWGRGGDLYGVFDKEDGVFRHVILKVDSCYLDANGARTKQEILSEYGGSEFVSLKKYRHDNIDSSIECPMSTVGNAVRLLREWFPR